MSEKPKRKWFQFHLLTAIAATVVVGICLGVNVIGRSLELPHNTYFDNAKVWGWPYPLFQEGLVKHDEFVEQTYSDQMSGHDRLVRQNNTWSETILKEPSGQILIKDVSQALVGNICLNLAVGLGLSVTCAASFEWFIRRREARKT